MQVWPAFSTFLNAYVLAFLGNEGWFFSTSTNLLVCFPGLGVAGQRELRFQAQTPEEARSWQQNARSRLFSLMMGGGEPARQSRRQGLQKTAG